MYHKLICILYALLRGQNFIPVKSGCYIAALQQASLEPLGSQEPPALPRKAPLRVMLLVVRRAVTPGVVARFKVPTGQRAVDRCSCMRYGECEPSII
jgi:hypothetical protein